jgi:hypothetical protein
MSFLFVSSNEVQRFAIIILVDYNLYPTTTMSSIVSTTSSITSSKCFRFVVMRNT